MSYRNFRIGLGLIAVMSSLALPGLAQQASVGGTSTATGTGSPVVPQLVNYSGVLTDIDGKPLTEIVGVTFSLYREAEGGSPLWMEIQNVQPTKSGHYSVMLGSTSSAGLPQNVFANGEARWLGVRAEGQAEQSRVMLLAVPYAMKAADAETLGGLPPSAFMQVVPPVATNVTSSSSTPAAVVTESAPPAGSVTGTGTVNFVPLWTSTSNIGNSVLFQSGSGSTAKIGINTSTPASTLDVKGGGTIRGTLILPATGTATATVGKTSFPIDLTASAFSSSAGTAVNQVFQWQAEPTGNNTASPSGTLNLLFGSGSTKPAETGLKLSSKGLFTFATGQTFPGTGKGTITGVSAGTDLTGGGTSGAVTLNLDTNKVPQLNTENNFTANQTITGNFVSISSYNALSVNQTSSSGWGMSVLSYGAGIAVDAVNGTGIQASSNGGYAVWGTTSLDGAGVYGDSESSGGYGVLATNNTSAGQALWAETFASGSSHGAGPDGVHGVSHSGNGSGVAGINDASGGIGVYGRQLVAGSYAGRFDGDVWVNGNLSKNGGSFKIDHPLDPSNKYLYHSFVESPDMKNIYDGVAALDTNGEAVVSMPEWFGALNRDFRYQLTCIGGFAPVYIAEEIADNHFKIGGGRPGMKVSWQVTGTRQDAWANAHRIPVEEIKPQDEHGTYLHPELFGAPESSAVGWGRYRFPDNAAPHKPLARPGVWNRGLIKSAQTAASPSH